MQVFEVTLCRFFWFKFFCFFFNDVHILFINPVQLLVAVYFVCFLFFVDNCSVSWYIQTQIIIIIFFFLFFFFWGGRDGANQY